MPKEITDEYIRGLTTVPEQLEGIAAVLCDDYCKYSATAMDEDALDKICANCPVSLLA